MTINETFQPTTIIPDTDKTRTCGTCEKPLGIDKFYKDGTDKDGNPKYRRDCKDCYRRTRLTERRNKRVPQKPIPLRKAGKK